MKAEPCGLALTLLSQHDVCPSCGWAASDHRGWQRELVRGAVPNPGRMTFEHVEFEGWTDEQREHDKAFEQQQRETDETHGPDCFGGSDYDDYDEEQARRTLERSRVFVPSDAPAVVRVGEPIEGSSRPCSCGNAAVSTGLDGRPICQWCTDNGENHPPSSSAPPPSPPAPEVERSPVSGLPGLREPPRSSSDEMSPRAGGSGGLGAPTPNWGRVARLAARFLDELGDVLDE